MLKFNISDTVPLSGMVSLCALQSEERIPSNTIALVTYHDNYENNLDIQSDTRGERAQVAEFVVGLYVIGGYAGTMLGGFYTESDPYDLCSYQLAVSDKVLFANDETRDIVLLPYQYQLKWDHYDKGGNPSGTISICYGDGTEVENYFYNIEYSAPMWEDYRDNATSMKYRYDRSITWNDGTPSNDVYRVRLVLPESLCFTNNTYYVRYNKVHPTNFAKIQVESGDITENHMEIINPEPLYYYGLDYSTIGYAGVFTRSETGLLPPSGIYIKRSDLNNIRVMLPDANSNESWMLKVWGGSFMGSVEEGLYYIPEIENYVAHAMDRTDGGKISPLCSNISYEEASHINNYFMRLKDYPLYFKTTEYPEYTPYNIYDGFHYIPAGWDTDPNYSHGINVYINDTLISNDNISDWDSWNSIIKLSSSVNYTDKINISYLYRNMYYTMWSPDVNPQIGHYNAPLGTHDYGITMPKNDSIVISILPSGFSSMAGTSLVWYYKSDNPDDTYDGTFYGYYSPSLLYTPGEATVPLTVNTKKLAEVSVIDYKPYDLVTVYDTRTPGGGLMEDDYFTVSRRSTTREHIQEESNYYSDIGLYDGQGLKKSGVLVITVPSSKITEIQDSILLETRGITTEQAYQDAISKIRDIIESNIAAGTYYVLVDENNIPISSLPGKVK